MNAELVRGGTVGAGEVAVEQDGRAVVLHVMAEVPLNPGGEASPVSVRMNVAAADALVNRIIDAMVKAKRAKNPPTAVGGSTHGVT